MMNQLTMCVQCGKEILKLTPIQREGFCDDNCRGDFLSKRGWELTALCAERGELKVPDNLTVEVPITELTTLRADRKRKIYMQDTITKAWPALRNLVSDQAIDHARQEQSDDTDN